MKIKTMLAALPLVALPLLGAVAPPAQAGTTDTASTMAVQAEHVPKVSVHLDDGANGVGVASAITAIRTRHRSEFVQRAVDAAFEKSGGRFNVIIMNLSQKHQQNLNGKRLYANIEFRNVRYGLWIAESGEFTNQGDGGWENWGYRGWFERTGNTVKFRKP
ncbi:MAG: hypothetical protein ABIQ18_35745 [Umezawaea sp.]